MFTGQVHEIEERSINHLLDKRSKLEEEVAKLKNTLKPIIKRVTRKPSKKIEENTIKLVNEDGHKRKTI